MTDEATNNVYATLTGEVNRDMVQKIFQAVSVATQNRVQNLHLMIHSPGGFIDDGVCLHNFLTNIPLSLHTYNCGAISSIAVLVFLAGKRRLCSPTATFMLHKSHGGVAPGSSPAVIQNVAASLIADDARTEAILKQHITMPQAQWDIQAKMDLKITATEAVQFGLAHDLGDFAPPLGAQIYNI